MSDYLPIQEVASVNAMKDRARKGQSYIWDFNRTLFEAKMMWIIIYFLNQWSIGLQWSTMIIQPLAKSVTYFYLWNIVVFNTIHCESAKRMCFNTLTNSLYIILTWINNHDQRKMWDEITYLFPNFNVYTVDVLEWINNFTSHVIMNVITYLCWHYSYSMLVCV